ncbi:hypothetical protein CHS0354_020354 [Potamilus streckersoni]|uniref:CUB domain-containing protein n=1 Tax=Potamilus streckersoni TaxID=2493646 RepID=A0AAE0SFW6_9BIVA|nr:hypothetical protein CHS0354_020354 [Potamilus streckersoni]
MKCNMGSGIFELLIIIWIGAYFQRTRATTKMYFMEDHCGGMVDFAQDDTSAASVQLTNNISYNNNLDCTFQIRAHRGKRLMIRFLNMDIEWGATCSDDYLIIFDGQIQDGKGVQGLRRRICGSVAPRDTYTTSGEIATLKFRSNAYLSDEGFHILLTAYRSSDSSCYMNEYQCRASLRCIENNLKCDQYDNCGDGSDECWTASSAIIGCIVGASVTVCLFTGLVVYCCCKRNKKPALEKERQEDESGSPGNISYSGYSLTNKPFTSSIAKTPSYNYSYSSRTAPSQIWITVPPSSSYGGVTKFS